MSDIENVSDDDSRSVASDDSDFIDTKMKEYNKTKGLPNIINDENSGDDASVADNDFDEEDDDDDDASLSSDSDIEEMKNVTSTTKPKKTQKPQNNTHNDEYVSDNDNILDANYDEDDEDDDDDDHDGAEYMRKFNENVRKDVISEYHHELLQQNYEEIEALCLVTRNKSGIIIDPLHRTLPFLTKYEKAKILGERAKQINAGAKPLIQIPDNLIDGYLIALKELEQKKIPFIIKRPLMNGGCEYWKLEDLEIL
jgi:DNA-directed RNA polymerase I, II, and III subunit RPABC2